MRWKVLIIVCMLLVLFLSLPTYAQPLKIALIMKAFTNPFFIQMRYGAIEAAVKFNTDLDYFSIKHETDIEDQIEIVERVIESGEYNGILIAPADSKRLIPPLKKAIDMGIKVINIDNKLDDDELKKFNLKIPFIGPDNLEAGEKIGNYVKNKLEGKGNVIIIEGIPTAINAIKRKEGFIKGLSGSNIKVIASLVANWHQDEAFNILLSFLSTYNGKINAILCANDEMALGAVQALYFLEKEGIIITGYDNIDEIRPFLWAKKVHATIEQHPFFMGEEGVKEIIDLLAGKKIPIWKKVPTDLITYDTFGKKIGVYFSIPLSFSEKALKKRGSLFGESVYILDRPESIPQKGLDILVIIGKDREELNKIENMIPNKKFPILFIKYNGASSPLLERHIINTATHYLQGISYRKFFKEIYVIR